MTRLYGSDQVCQLCRQPGRWGWLYRCTQDRDEIIENNYLQGEDVGPAHQLFPIVTDPHDQVSIDVDGQKLFLDYKARKRSPAERTNKLSFLGELTPEQMRSYTPAQIAIILEQRENVQNTIQKDRAAKNVSTLFLRLRLPTKSAQAAVHSSLEHEKPWVPTEDHECQYKVCGFCRPGCDNRTYVSLNAVLAGEIPPAVAAGFGFEPLGARPVCKAQIVVNMGLRPNPLVRFLRPFSRTGLFRC
jgi:hypothetical protein